MVRVRVDKWLWAVRVYKTRAQATEACRKGRVIVNGQVVKPSKEIGEGDRITVRKLPVVFNYEVKQTVENRLPAKRVHEFLEDKTSLEELDKLKVNETFVPRRKRGEGRPTKRERRQLDELNDNIY